MKDKKILVTIGDRLVCSPVVKDGIVSETRVRANVPLDKELCLYLADTFAKRASQLFPKWFRCLSCGRVEELEEDDTLSTGDYCDHQFEEMRPEEQLVWMSRHG